MSVPGQHHAPLARRRRRAALRAARHARLQPAALRLGTAPHVPAAIRQGSEGSLAARALNPGPWGMAQTGVPFGEVSFARDWLQLRSRVLRPANEHPKRPVQGFDCTRKEVSGARLWGWAQGSIQRRPKRFSSASLSGTTARSASWRTAGAIARRTSCPAKSARRCTPPAMSHCKQAVATLAAAHRDRHRRIRSQTRTKGPRRRSHCSRPAPKSRQSTGQSRLGTHLRNSPARSGNSAFVDPTTSSQEAAIDIGTLLPEHARYRPDLPALKVSASECTFAQLNAQVNRLANAMLATGIAKGDKVSTLMTNRLELVLMLLGRRQDRHRVWFCRGSHERRGGNPEAGNPRQLPGVLTACCIAPALIAL